MVDPMRPVSSALVALVLTLPTTLSVAAVTAAPAHAKPQGTTGNDVISGTPRANRIIIEEGGKLLPLSLRNPHPEISFSALWGKVWYENYDEPKYVWQSTASNTDFEPKLSLSPLTFGTLKAAFYAMILAAPLAIAAAIYTAYFMAPGMRRKVKPVIELMEAMPTVILGFFAGLFLAPYLEGHLPGVFSLFLLMPLGILLAGFAWTRLPESIRLRIPDGWEAAILIPVILFTGWFATMGWPPSPMPCWPTGASRSRPPGRPADCSAPPRSSPTASRSHP